MSCMGLIGAILRERVCKSAARGTSWPPSLVQAWVHVLMLESLCLLSLSSESKCYLGRHALL